MIRSLFKLTVFILLGVVVNVVVAWGCAIGSSPPPFSPRLTYPYADLDGRNDLDSSGSRVLRGGSWINFEENLRAANRNNLIPDSSDLNIGFRCALSVAQLAPKVFERVKQEAVSVGN